MYEGMVGTNGLIMWSRNDEAFDGSTTTTDYGSNSMWGLVRLLKKVHALGSYLLWGKHVGMCVCVKVA